MPSERVNPKTFRCADCGAETTSYLDDRLCSACRKIADRVAADPDWQPGRKTLRTRPCITCGTDVICRASRVLCADCRLTRDLDRNRTKSGRRTARLRPGIPSRLLGQYGGRCGICRLPIDQALRWPHPLCLTLDHIHPLAAGGPDTEDNLWPAHRRCNEEKGDDLGYRPWTDSALFGVAS